MENRIVKCQDLNISNSNKICLIAGPCQLETEQHALDMAGEIKKIAIFFISPAISSACCSVSNWQGPAIKQILFELDIFKS